MEIALEQLTSRLRAGRYICQIESAFPAIAEYTIADTNRMRELMAIGSSKKIATSAGELRRALNEVVREQMGMETSKSTNVILTGKLVFAVKLEPIYISPAHAIFVRTWPHSQFSLYLPSD